MSLIKLSLISFPINLLQEKLVDNLSPTSKGILLALFSSTLFVSVAVIVRMLSKTIDPVQILLFRQIIFLIILVPAIYSNLNILLKPNKIKLHMLRIGGAFVALYGGFIAVGNLPFADATALGFLQVLFVAVLARLFLSEYIGVARKFTIVTGFVGVMLIVRPTFEDSSFIYMLYGISASFGAAIAVTCVRKVAKTEPRITLLVYQALFVGMMTVIPSMYVWQWPTTNEWILLILIGVISSVAQWIGITAYKFAQANVVANVEYVKIIYSLLVGYLLFSEMPDVYAIMGAIMIIMSVAPPTLIKLIRKIVTPK